MNGSMKWFVTSFLCINSCFFAEETKKKVVPQETKVTKEEAIAYDADLFKRDTAVFSFHGTFLFWRVQEGALDYALKMQHPASSGISYASGKYHEATFNGEPGFRIAASYFRAPKYWEIWGQYTRLTASGSDKVKQPTAPNRYLVGTWPQGTTGTLSEAESHIHMNYNVADLLVDRFFNPNAHLRIRFLGGATAAWIQQNWVVRYRTTADVITQIRNQWKFIGGGIRIGSDLSWYWTDDVYFTAQTTLGTLIGSYKTRVKQSVIDIADLIRDARYSDVRPAVVIQTIFGPSWQKNFTSTRIEIFAGYELNTWFNLQEVYRSTAAAADQAKETWQNTGLIALQGLNARLSLDF